MQGVWRSYGDLVAVRDLSFEVARGEVVALLGPNGAGKTTALRMIATLIPADRGVVSVAGADVATDPRAARARLGYQTGDTGLYARLTPREFLNYFGQLHEVPADVLSDRVERLIDVLDIGSYADRLCGNLSTGQRQRVSVARALVNDPPVLVLDEPTSGLDIVSARVILDALRHLAREERRAVLFSTHVMSEVELIADRVVVISAGHVVAEGTVDAVCAIAGARALSQAFLTLVGASR